MLGRLVRGRARGVGLVLLSEDLLVLMELLSSGSQLCQKHLLLRIAVIDYDIIKGTLIRFFRFV